jgi:hypothetical protein
MNFYTRSYSELFKGVAEQDWNGVAFGKTIIGRRKTSHELLYTLIKC